MDEIKETFYDTREVKFGERHPEVSNNELSEAGTEEVYYYEDENMEGTDYYALAEHKEISQVGPMISSVLDLENPNIKGEVYYYNGKVVDMEDAGPFFYETLKTVENSNPVGTVSSNPLDPKYLYMDTDDYYSGEDSETIPEDGPNVGEEWYTDDEQIDNGNTAGVIYNESVQPNDDFDSIGTVSSNSFQPGDSSTGEQFYYDDEQLDDASADGLMYYESIPEGSAGNYGASEVLEYYNGERFDNTNTGGVVYYENAVPEESTENYETIKKVLEYYEDETEDDYYTNDEVELCPDGSECFNGSKCLLLKQGDQMVYECDCTTIRGAIPFAGNGCRNPATSYCSYYGQNKDSFCTNNGVCRKLSVPNEYGFVRHHGCKCLDGFKGPYCEFQQQVKVQSTKAVTVSHGHFALIFSLSMLLCLAVLSVVAVFTRKRNMEQSYEELKVNDPTKKDEQATYQDNQVGEVDKSRPIV